MDTDARVEALIAPVVEGLIPRLGADLRADLEAWLRGEARALVSTLEEGLTERDLRDLLLRQAESELLGAPPERRAAVLRAATGERALVAQLEPLGLAARELLRAFRARGLTPELEADARTLMKEIVRVARAAPSEVLARERGTVSVILSNVAIVLTDGLLGPDTSVEVG